MEDKPPASTSCLIDYQRCRRTSHVVRGQNLKPQQAAPFSSVTPLQQRGSRHACSRAHLARERDTHLLKGTYNGWIIEDSAPAGYPPTASEVSPPLRKYNSLSEHGARLMLRSTIRETNERKSSSFHANLLLRNRVCTVFRCFTSSDRNHQSAAQHHRG